MERWCEFDRVGGEKNHSLTTDSLIVILRLKCMSVDL